jgi:hypothetical protein
MANHILQAHKFASTATSTSVEVTADGWISEGFVKPFFF